MFLTHVFSKHRVPSHVTLDWGTKFISHFFHSLGKLLQMELHFTSGYHPEGDSQTKCINQVLEQYLRAYTNYQQDNWAALLLLANLPITMGLVPPQGYSHSFPIRATTPIYPHIPLQQSHLQRPNSL